MPLIDILEKINKEAQDRLKQIKKEFDEKKAKLEEENKKKQKMIDEEMHNKIDEKSKKIIEKAENLAEREKKNQLLVAKREIIDKALHEAIEKLSKSENYEEIITEMLKRTSLESENTVVMPAKGKEEETRNAIKNSEKGYFLSDKSISIKGGFILKTDKIEIDNSFETIINDQLRSALEIKLHKLLF